MKIMSTFRQQGGKDLLVQMIRNKALVVSFIELLSLGKSKTALEIIRLSNQLKVKNKLKRKYGKTINNFKTKFKPSGQEPSNNVIWFCWLQGIDEAPKIVKRCYESLKRNIVSKKIIVITEDNFGQYTTIPDCIVEKYKNGIITKTHFTDILRIWLLAEKGGTWIDATVFCSSPEKNIPNFYLDSDLFVFQNLKPGRDGHAYYISSWFMTAKKNNRVICLTKELLEEYWRKERKMVDYFLLHAFFSISLDIFSDEWKKIVPVDNSFSHILLLRMFDKFDEEIWESTTRQVPFHKLSYKFDVKKTRQTGTFYEKVVRYGER